MDDDDDDEYDHGLNRGMGSKYFTRLQNIQPGSKNPAPYSSADTGILYPGIKPMRRACEHITPPSAQIKNE
jgi:hypothetical protein